MIAAKELTLGTSRWSLPATRCSIPSTESALGLEVLLAGICCSPVEPATEVKAGRHLNGRVHLVLRANSWKSISEGGGRGDLI